MSDILITLLILVIFAALLGSLFMLKKQNKSFTFRVVGALVIGLIFGAALQAVLGYDSAVVNSAMDWIALVGSGYVRLLRMIVMPLIFISILYAFITQRSQNLGKLTGRVLAVLMGTVAISALIGALTTAAFGLTA